jgi:hypothetical protein
VAWIHQIHAAGGPSGSTTTVVVFVGCLCCGMVQAWVAQKTLKRNILRVFTMSDLLNI